MMKLITPFLSDSLDFALGFEAGKCYQQMQEGENPIEGMYHLANQDQLFLTAGNLGYTVREWQKRDDTWMHCIFEKDEMR
jgi:hypothetical protein